MPGSTSSLLPILRQLCRVRRRWNTRELARAALSLVAASGVLGAVLVLAALAMAPRRFVAAAALIAAAWAASAVAIGLAARRRWLRRATAHRQVDRHARLYGRLATIVDLGAREASALRPLLTAEAAAILPLWTARRLVPRRAPAGALAAAAAGGGALLLAVALAPTLVPPPGPTVLVRDADAPRVPVRPGQRGMLPRGGTVAENQSAGTADEADDSFLGGVAETLQFSLHRRLWGEAEAIRAQEVARAETAQPAPEPPRADSAPRGDGRDGESNGRVEPGEAGEDEGTDVAHAVGTPEAGGPTGAGEATRNGGVADGAARGAGTATSPDLYGAPTGGIHRAVVPFTLGLTANVHVTGGGPRPPTGDTPVQMPDANPALAESPGEAIAVPRAPVPPEYAAIVRRLFEREP